MSCRPTDDTFEATAKSYRLKTSDSNKETIESVCASMIAQGHIATTGTTEHHMICVYAWCVCVCPKAVANSVMSMTLTLTIKFQQKEKKREG